MRKLRAWLIAAAVIVLISAHGIALYRLSSHSAEAIAVASGVTLLVLIKLGLLGSFTRYADVRDTTVLRDTI